MKQVKIDKEFRFRALLDQWAFRIEGKRPIVIDRIVSFLALLILALLILTCLGERLVHLDDWKLI